MPCLLLRGCIFKRFTVPFKSRRRFFQVLHQGCQEVLVPGMLVQSFFITSEPRLGTCTKIKVLFDVIWATINTCWSYKWEFHHSAKGNDWESDTPLSLSFFSMSGFSPTQLAMLVIAWMQVVAGSAPSCRRLALNGWDKACNKWTQFLVMSYGNPWVEMRNISGLLFVLQQLSLCFRCRVFLLITKNRFRLCSSQGMSWWDFVWTEKVLGFQNHF